MRTIIATSNDFDFEIPIETVISHSGFSISHLVTGMHGKGDIMGWFWAVKSHIPNTVFKPVKTVIDSQTVITHRDKSILSMSDALVVLYGEQEQETDDWINLAIKQNLKVFIYYYKTHSGEWINCDKTDDKKESDNMKFFAYLNQVDNGYQVLLIDWFQSIMFFDGEGDSAIRQALNTPFDLTWMIQEKDNSFELVIHAVAQSMDKIEQTIKTTKMNSNIFQVMNLVHNFSSDDRKKKQIRSILSFDYDQDVYYFPNKVNLVKEIINSDELAVDVFEGPYSYLSNFHDHAFPVTFNDNGREIILTFRSSEHYYQAMKATNPNDFMIVVNSPNAFMSKKNGRKITIRPDWDDIKQNVMYDVLRYKFSYNQVLGQMLLMTGNKDLIEGNYWGDTYWGMCNGQGSNHLGIQLTEVRFDLAEGTLWNKKVILPYWME